MQSVVGDFADTTTTANPPTPDVLGMIESWLDATKKHIFEKLQRFEPVPGWKLVKGRPGNRAWKDGEQVETLLKSWRFKKAETHEEKLRSPAQIEKIVPEKKWALLEVLLDRADAKPTMVAATDKRPALEPAKADEFDIFS